MKIIENKLKSNFMECVSYAADMLCLWFGKEFIWINSAKERIKANDFELYFQCPWRFSIDDEIIMGSYDFYVKVSEKNFI